MSVPDEADRAYAAFHEAMRRIGEDYEIELGEARKRKDDRLAAARAAYSHAIDHLTDRTD